MPLSDDFLRVSFSLLFFFALFSRSFYTDAAPVTAKNSREFVFRHPPLSLTCTATSHTPLNYAFRPIPHSFFLSLVSPFFVLFLRSCFLPEVRTRSFSSPLSHLTCELDVPGTSRTRHMLAKLATSRESLAKQRRIGSHEVIPRIVSNLYKRKDSSSLIPSKIKLTSLRPFVPYSLRRYDSRLEKERGSL